MKKDRSDHISPHFLIYVFLLFVVGIFITGISIYVKQRNQIKTSAQNDLEAIADLKVNQIHRWLQERMIDANLIYNNSALVHQVNDYLKSPAKPVPKQDLLKFMESMQDQIGYKSVILIDTKGNICLSASDEYNILSPHAQNSINKALHDGMIEMSDLHKSETVPFPHIDLIVPFQLTDKGKKAVIGALLLRIDPEQVLFPLIQTWPIPSRTSETLLLRQDGDSIVYLNELRHCKNTILTLRIPISNHQLIAVMAVSGKTGIVEGIDYRGVQVLAAIRNIPNSKWYMISKIDQEEVYSSIRSQAWIVGITIFLLILTTAAVVGFWWRNQNARFYREHYLDELERQALIQHYDYIIKYANDIILLINMDGRIVEANERACNAYGYTREELLQRYIHDLRSPKTRHQVDDQMKQVAEKSGLVFETEHMRKDGTLFPVEVSSRFIEIEEVRFYQSIIRDITERKRGEEALKTSEAMLSESQHIASLGHYELDIHSGNWTSSKELDEIFGIDQNYTKNVEGWVNIVHPDFREEMSAYLREYIIKGKNPFNKEYKIIRIDNGAVRWLHGLGKLKIDDEGKPIKMFGTIQDITKYKQVEESVQEINETLNTIFEAAPLPIYILDIEGRVQKVWNPAVEKLLGWKKEEVFGKALPSVPLGKQDEFQKLLEQIKSGQSLNGVQVVRQRKDGSIIEYSIYATPLHNNKGKVTGNIIMLVDLTERRQAEHVIRQSENLFKMLVETSPVAIIVFTGPSKKIEYISHRYKELFGYEKEDIPTMDAWWPLAYPTEQYRNQIEIKWCEILAKAQNEGIETEPVESVMTCKDGTTKYVESTYMTIGEQTLMFFTDLTQHRMAEEALRQTHTFNDLLIQTIPFGIDIVDEEGKILFMSKAMKSMLKHDATNTCCWEVYKDNKQQCTDCPLRKGITFGKQEIIESAGVFGGRTYQISHVGMMYEGQKAMLEVFQDITEQKKLQQELIQSQKLLSIGTMAGGIAHDFNNILAIILGYSSILLSIKDNPQRFSDGVTAIRQAVDRGAGLVRQILTFARKADTSFQPLSIPDLVKELVSMLQQTFPKIITFDIKMEKPLPYINADHTQMHQALLNLCVNARDAMPNGGQISICAQTLALEKVKEFFPSAVNQWYIHMSVADTGMGIEEQVRNQIFDPFFTTKEKGKGTGLGLSVVYGIVQAHHGLINVASSLGQGTTFHLYLPIPRESSTVLEIQEQAEEQITGGTETLLFVEDESLLIDMVQILLESNGYKVLTAKDGEEAIEVYSQNINEIALVISDMGLPKLTGIAEFEKLKQINPDVKIIFASGYFEPDMRSTLEAAGAKGFLQKPYVTEDILKMIRKVLDAK